jgi:hypothetical protein
MTVRVRREYFRAHLVAERRQMMQHRADYLDELRAALRKRTAKTRDANA